ncbi:MAG: carboxypeptidase regulatory-like domain-containing protein [Acidobacteriia bacterium]|nr:carboxypeptidase regulatory-like domain-containing protein [Terriglobia bacterium]
MIPRVVARTHGAPRSIAILVALVLLVSASALFGQKKKDDQGNTRSVQGEVTAQDDSTVAGAVVQLKNTKTLQIRSFITKENGSYYFNGLSPDVDYELRAESQGLSSSTKTLSSFDSRKAATINLKLNKK